MANTSKTLADRYVLIGCTFPNPAVQQLSRDGRISFRMDPIQPEQISVVDYTNSFSRSTRYAAACLIALTTAANPTPT